MRYSKINRKVRPSVQARLLAALEAIDQALDHGDVGWLTEEDAIDAGWVDDEAPPTVPRPEFAAKWAAAMNDYPDIIDVRAKLRNFRPRP